MMSWHGPCWGNFDVIACREYITPIHAIMCINAVKEERSRDSVGNPISPTSYNPKLFSFYIMPRSERWEESERGWITLEYISRNDRDLHKPIGGGLVNDQLAIMHCKTINLARMRVSNLNLIVPQRRVAFVVVVVCRCFCPDWRVRSWSLELCKTISNVLSFVNK